jgi:hypothetical protein
MHIPCRPVAVVLLMTAALACAARPAQAQAAPAAPTFAAAMSAYETNHWAQSYEMLAHLADGGHAEAARIAAQMHRWGPRLYGQRFPASAAQLARWQQLAWCQGSASAPCTVATQAR